MTYRIRYGRVAPHPKQQFSSVKVEIERETSNIPEDEVRELAILVNRLLKLGISTIVEDTKTVEGP